MMQALGPRVETLFWAAGTVLFILVGSYLVAVVARWLAARFKLSRSEQQRIFWGFLFASPWIIGFVIFVVGPSLASLYYSFTEYKLGTTPEWIGLENFRELIQAKGRDGRNFRSSMYNSMYYAVVGVPLQVTASLLMAMLLNLALKGISVFRLVYYLPVILAGGPAILLAWRYMLSANGGFVNESIHAVGAAITPFAWVTRASFFAVEGFNGFFIGLTKGDPTGPLNFFLPALVGMIVCFLLLRGDWEDGKRTIAQRVAEVLIFGIGGIIVAVGLMAEPIHPAWVLVWTLIILLGIRNSARQETRWAVLVWQVVGLLVLAFGVLATFLTAPENSATVYLMSLALGAGAIVLTFWSSRDRSKYRLMAFVALLLAGGILLQIVPPQFGGGKAAVLFQYLTLQSALAQPDNLDYLKDFSLHYFDSIWLFGAVALVAVVVLGLDDRYRRLRRYLLIGGFVFFLLITVSAAADSVRYFQAYEAISEVTGSPNYHFARYREATSAFPDATHNPKWLSSDLWVKPALIMINMWSAGAGMLIFLAALKGVPTSLYEAAKVDGANPLQRFLKITLPLISPAMFYNIVIGMIAALQTFEPVYILRTTETETSIMSAAFYLYRRTFEQANIGEGAAMSWLLALVIVGLTVAQFRYSNWVNYEV